METATPGKYRLTVTLLVIAAVLLCAVSAMLFLTRPWEPAPAIETQPPTEAPTLAPTDPPTEPPTEEPTEPPAELNPYGIFDFQYDGRYLKLLEGESITGIDVSIYQGEIDWEKVKESGVEFVMVRLGFRGSYFFSQATSVEEALEEAEFVLDILDGMELDMPLVYDWEYISDTARTAYVDRRTLTDCSLAFLGKIEEAGYWPMLYFNTGQARRLLYLSELNQYDFWLALYSNRMTFPYKIKMWQYTCTGTVPGIEGDCDINIYFPESAN